MNSSEYVFLSPETFTQTTSYSLKHFYQAKTERTQKQNDTILSISSISTKNTEKEERNDYSISDISEFDLDNDDY